MKTCLICKYEKRYEDKDNKIFYYACNDGARKVNLNDVACEHFSCHICNDTGKTEEVFDSRYNDAHYTYCTVACSCQK